MSKDAQQLAERLAGKGSTKHNYLIKKKYSGASKKVITASKKIFKGSLVVRVALGHRSQCNAGVRVALGHRSVAVLLGHDQTV